MNDPKPLRFVQEPPPGGDAGTAYAGRTRYTQLEYEALLGNLPLGIAFTRERRFFLCNPKFAEMFGYGHDELIGMAGEAVYPSSESYLALGQIAGPILAAGRQVDIEWEVKRKDGSTFVCRMIAKTLDAADPQQGTVWIVEDITDRRRHADDAARLLREHEATLGTASVGIVFLKDRRIVRCNRRYEEMYGYAPGELVGKPTAVLYAREEDLANAPAAYDQLRRGRTSSRVEQRKRKDGSVFWTRAAGRAVDPQDPLKGSVWTVEDVTEQRRAEDELQRVLAEQQALLDNVVVGIAISRERKVVRCNRRFEEMFGFGAGEANGVSWRQMYFTDEEFELRGQVYADLDQGRTHGREQWLRRQDGSGFWCKVSGRAVAQGDPARGYVWLTEDISERRRADEALERLVREQDAVLQNAVTGIIFVKDRRIVRCNRRFEDIFGYGHGELLNRSTRFMFASDADYDAGGEALYEPVWRGETVYAERRHVRKDGSLIWCSLSGRAVQPGDPAQGSVWLFDDITQEHESEERVQRALAEQELILDNASV
ncbi:MAG TPA: PAS domain-containing protein, partial [Burkholderiales bacterium]|nr:PAS domain-containing protein [Burkholderiales bacterium]